MNNNYITIIVFIAAIAPTVILVNRLSKGKYDNNYFRYGFIIGFLGAVLIALISRSVIKGSLGLKKDTEPANPELANEFKLKARQAALKDLTKGLIIGSLVWIPVCFIMMLNI